jgi:hypothetical protein
VKASQHPYQSFADKAFWSRSVARGWTSSALISTDAPLLRPDDLIVSAGSCFAANIVPHLEAVGYQYLRTEIVEEDDDRFNYSRYSASYGNIYTARQFRQLVERFLGRFKPVEDRWMAADAVIDPYRPGLPFAAEDEDEFELLTQSHLKKTRQAFEQATVLVFTLGLTEAWVSSLDGAAFPACPGVIAGTFDATRHRFVNFRVHEIVEDMRAALAQLREINPNLRVLLTVSPVPLVATATGEHVYVANFYSKAALRAAAQEIAESEPSVTYFPAMEIVLGMDAGANFEADLRNVSAAGVARVMDALLGGCRLPTNDSKAGPTPSNKAAEALSKLLVRKECEEAAYDKRGA